MRPKSPRFIPYHVRLLALMACVLWLVSVPASAQSNTLSMSFGVEPSVVVVNETNATFTVSLAGDASTCPPTSTPPMDVVVIIDTPSLSAAELSGIQNALDPFLNQMKLAAAPEQGDQIGVISLSGAAPIATPMSRDSATIRAALTSPTAGGSLTLSDGLRTALNTDLSSGSVGVLLEPTTQNAAAERAIVVISARTTDADITRWSDLGRSAGARLISVGVGAGASSALLSGLASSPSDFIAVSDFTTAMTQLGQRLQLRTAANTILFSVRYDAASMTIDPNSLIPPGAIDAALNTITWSRARVTGGETAQFSFRAQLRNTSPVTALALGAGSYYACSANPTNTTPAPTTSALSASPLTIQAVFPTPTPEPTATITPIVPTAIPTEDTSPRFLDAVSTPIPANQPTTIPGGGLALCADDSSNVLLWILALILFLIWLFFLWRWFNHARTDKGWLCFLAKAAFLAALLAFIFSLFVPVVASMCEVREIVYFWRQDNTTGETGIYQSVPNQRAAVPVTTLNRGCVGCHSTSPGGAVIAVVEGIPPGSVNATRPDGGVVRLPVTAAGQAVSAMYIAFSPDGRNAVIADGNADLILWDTTTGQTTPLAGASDPTVTETMPSWGPDGRIAFVRAAHGDVEYSGLNIETSADIYTIPITGGVAEPLIGATSASGGGRFNYYPAYSPDGRWLAFTSHDNQRTYGDPRAEIFLVPASGGSRIRLSANDDANGNPTSSNSWASWSLDGRYLAFNSRRTDPNFDIYVTEIGADGSSSAATPLPGASEAGVFEHTPFWGIPLARVDILREWQNLLPWLIPVILLWLLAWLLCRGKKSVSVTLPPIKPTTIQPATKPTPPPNLPLTVEYKVTPTLVIGMGETGRWVLTHLKHSLTETSLGNLPDHVKLLAVDAGRSTDENDRVIFAGTELAADELLEIKDSLNKFLGQDDLPSQPAFRKWLNPSHFLGRGAEANDMRYGLKRQRVLARVGLLKHLQEERDNGLTHRLKSLIPDAIEDGRLNVILVADTSGDMGSALLFDMAAIVRRLADDAAEDIKVTAHIITDREDKDRTSAVNTAAFLREAKRIQLTESNPFKIYFGREDLDGLIDQLLIDQVNLYDNEVLAHQQRGADAKANSQAQKQYGLYPLVADTVMLSMDRAMQATALREVVSNERNNTVNAQRETYDLMLASSGLLQLRLPIHYLFKKLALRYMYEIFERLLGGVGLMEEEFAGTKDPSELADKFLSGQLSVKSDKETTGNGVIKGMTNPVQVLANQVVGNTQVDRAVLERALHDVTGKEEQLIADMQERLKTVTIILLNGQSHIQPKIGRSGKMDFTVLFLEAVSAGAKRVTESLSLARGLETNKTLARTVLEKVNELAQSFAKDIAGQKSSFIGDTGKGATKNKGIRNEIARRLSEVTNQQTDLNRLVTRHYIWDVKGQSLEETWYRYAFDQYLDRVIELLYWRTSEDGSLVLSMIMPGGETIQYTQDEIREFVNRDRPANDTSSITVKTDTWIKTLEDVVNYYTNQMGAEDGNGEGINFSTILNQLLQQDLLSIDKRAQTVEGLSSNAYPLLSYDGASGGNPIPTDYLAVNLNVTKDAVREQLTAPMANTEQFHTINTTDPFSLTVQRRIAVVPLRALQIQNVWSAYNEEYGLDTNRNSATLKSPIPSAVYEAEAVALALEQRFVKDLNVDPRQLHALVVSALTESERVKAFCLAIAAGEVELRSRRGEQIKDLWLLADEAGDDGVQIQPYHSGKTDTRLHPFIWGLHTFSLKEKALPNELFEKMFKRYRTNTGIQSTWQTWLNGSWQNNLANDDPFNRQAVEDLIRIARLWAKDFSR